MMKIFEIGTRQHYYFWSQLGNIFTTIIYTHSFTSLVYCFLIFAIPFEIVKLLTKKR